MWICLFILVEDIYIWIVKMEFFVQDILFSFFMKSYVYYNLLFL